MGAQYQYAVKFVCGNSEGKVAAPGSYWTAINVHNPWTSRVPFRKRISIGLPAEKAGPVSPPFDALLGPDESLEIDRDDIFQHAHFDAKFVKGFVVIRSPMELDVVAVYTASGATKQVESIHVERVAARTMKVLDADLVAVPDPKTGFCRIEGSVLLVTVKNQGGEAAGTSTTRVDFGKYGKVDRPTPALNPGQAVDLKFPIPPGSFDPDCDFTITVDVNNEVVESNESNSYSGTCIG